MEVSDVARMQEIEDEHRKLKKLLAEAPLEKEAIEDAFPKSGNARQRTNVGKKLPTAMEVRSVGGAHQQ